MHQRPPEGSRTAPATSFSIPTVAAPARPTATQNIRSWVVFIVSTKHSLEAAQSGDIIGEPFGAEDECHRPQGRSYGVVHSATIPRTIVRRAARASNQTNP